MRYFDHDTTSLMDDKIIALRLEHGPEAVYCYWGILEKMYADEAPVRIAMDDPETNALSYRLAIAKQTLSEYVATMVKLGLLQVFHNDNTYISERAFENISAYQEKRKNAQRAGKMGGKANAKRTSSGRKANAKPRKEKKSIGTYTVPNTLDASGADAEKSAPSAPKCPLCGTALEETGITSEPFWCPNCSTGFKAEKVVA